MCCHKENYEYFFKTLVVGTDYLRSSGSITFSPREQQKMIQLSIVDDNFLEEKEESFTVELNITSSVPGLVIGNSEITVTIEDDDCKEASHILAIDQLFTNTSFLFSCGDWI